MRFVRLGPGGNNGNCPPPLTEFESELNGAAEARKGTRSRVNKSAGSLMPPCSGLDGGVDGRPPHCGTDRSIVVPSPQEYSEFSGATVLSQRRPKRLSLRRGVLIMMTGAIYPRANLKYGITSVSI
jgi:hypothetical protein